MATSVHLAPVGNAFQFFDSVGKPLNAGQLFTYAAGTSTPQATYSESTGTFINANPIVLGIDGRVPAEVWLVDGLSYKFVLQDSLGGALASYDNLYGVAKTTAQENFNVKDFGAIGDGNSDDSPAFQAALNAIPATGGNIFVPDGQYRIHGLIPKPNTTWTNSGGAVLLADGSSSMVTIANTALQTPALTLVTNNGLVLTVASTAGMSAGDYVIVSAGHTGGDGPLEFNQIDTVSSGTVLIMARPLQIDYSTLGLTGANPRVIGLGPNPVRNFRMSGGKVSAWNNVFDGIMFVMTQCESVEIDHVLFDGGAGVTANGLGGIIINGSSISNLVFRNNVLRGERTQNGFAAMEITALANSIIRDNIFNVGNPYAGALSACLANHILLGASWRNRIDSNLMYPLAFPAVAAIDLNTYSFMNMVRGNQIYGNPFLVQGGTNLMGIDGTRLANVSGAAGNIITGNILNDVLHGITDVQATSVIKDNVLSNFYLNAGSVGITSATSESLSPWYTNTFSQIQTPIVQSSGGPAGRIQLNSVTFANVGTPSNGTMLYVSDGTPASNPLTGAGTGCVAIRQNGAWKGL